MIAPLFDAASAAKACEAATGLPAALTMAQWALESGWGQHSPGNNCFGIKSYPGSQKQLLATNEWFNEAERDRWLARAKGRIAVKDSTTPKRNDGRELYHCRDWFAAFDSLEACFVKHAQLITEGEPYAEPWAAFLDHRKPEQLARDIAPIYATDPAYALKIASLMNHSRVQIALSADSNGSRKQQIQFAPPDSAPIKPRG